jgi:hypothetical protein
LKEEAMNFIFQKSLMLALVAAFAVSQTGTAVGQANPGEFRVVVDIGTGELILEVGAGNQVIAIESVSGANVFDTTALDVPTDFVTPQQLEPNGIAWLSLVPFPAGPFNLGAIIAEPSRTLEGIEDLQVRGRETGSVGNVGNGRITVINSAIPEPGSLSLLVLAGLGVVACRRR